VFVLNPYKFGKTQLLTAKHVTNIVTIGLHMVNKRCKTHTVPFIIHTTRSKARKYEHSKLFQVVLLNFKSWTPKCIL